MRKDARADSAADVRGGDSGGHWRQNNRKRIGQGAAQKRYRQVLRRRYHTQTQAAGKTERRETQDETGRSRRDTPGGVSGSPQGWRLGVRGQSIDAGVEHAKAGSICKSAAAFREIRITRIC